MRALVILTVLGALVAVASTLLLAGGRSATATPPCTVDGVIGAEWTGVTPTFVDYIPPGIAPAPGASHVDFNVYVRADATCVYVAAQAIPVAGDLWDDVFTLGLGSSANIYLDTNVDSSSDVIILPLGTDIGSGDPGYCDAADTVCNQTNFGAAGPSVYSAGNEGAPYPSVVTDPPVMGGVREIGIPWSVLQTDPDSIGYPKSVCSVNVRTVQAFGYNFSGSQFDPTRFGTVSIPGCPTNKDQCKNGGWKTFTVPKVFKNQGDCIQFVNTGK